MLLHLLKKAKNISWCIISFELSSLIKYCRQEPGKDLKRRETLASIEFDSRGRADQVQDEESTNRLIEVLKGANPTCGYMKYRKPALNDSNIKVCIQDSQEIVHTVKHFLDFYMPASILDIKSDAVR